MEQRKKIDKTYKILSLSQHEKQPQNVDDSTESSKWYFI